MPREIHVGPGWDSTYRSAVERATTGPTRPDKHTKLTLSHALSETDPAHFLQRFETIDETCVQHFTKGAILT